MRASKVQYLLLILSVFISIQSLATNPVFSNIKTSNEQFKSGDFQQGLASALKALELAEKSNIPKELMHANLQVGVAHYYINQANKPTILKYFYKSLVLAEYLQADSLLPILYHNIGSMYVEHSQGDSAEKYMGKSLQIFLQKKNYAQASRASAVIAEMYLNNPKAVHRSVVFIKNAMQYALLSNDSAAFAFALIKQGLYNYVTKNYKEAIKHFDRVERIYSFLKNKQGLLYVTRLTAMSHAEAANPTINKLYDKYYDLRDSIFKEETASQIAEYQTKYATEKKERENKILQQENKIKHQQLNTRNKTIFTLVLLILLIVAFVLWRLNVINLKKKKQELEALKKIEDERNRISRDLHDNVGSMVSFVNTKIDWIIKNKSIDNELLTDLSLVKDNAKEILEGLRDSIWTLSSVSITNFELVDKLKPYIKSHLLIPYTIQDELIDEIVMNNEVVLALYRSCQEIINNMNKHSGADKVEIRFFNMKDMKLGIEFYDNGVGIKANDCLKENHYGIRNLKARLHEIQAKFEILPVEKGTLIRILI